MGAVWYREGMVRNYPLTWLFIVATLCVDLAIIFSASAGSVLTAETGLRFYVWNYAIPAQLSTLALWGVFGNPHRLTKAAWVTFACGILFLITWYTVEGLFRNESISFNLIQILIVITGSVLLKLCGIGKPVKTAQARAFQFSLVEIFGWTMIVALWAFGLRFAGANFQIDQYWIVWLTAASLPPLLVAPVLFSKIPQGWRLLGLLLVYLFEFIAYAVAAALMPGPMPLWSLAMAITQITYISAWWSVGRMDQVMQQRRAVIAESEETLAIYEPKQSD